VLVGWLVGCLVEVMVMIGAIVVRRWLWLVSVGGGVWFVIQTRLSASWFAEG